MLRPWLLLLMTAVLLTTGCTNTVVPPARVADPVHVYLLDHGRTPTLVLPDDGAWKVRYAYGDRRWYALGRTGPLDAVAALFWPTRSALGRERFVADGGPASIGASAAVSSERVYAIVVERSAAEALRRQLGSLYRSGAEIELVPNRAAGLAFVPHPRRYCLFHNSNHVAARWLEDLGCQVRGLRAYSSWRIEPAPE